MQLSQNPENPPERLSRLTLPLPPVRYCRSGLSTAAPVTLQDGWWRMRQGCNPDASCENSVACTVRPCQLVPQERLC